MPKWIDAHSWFKSGLNVARGRREKTRDEAVRKALLKQGDDGRKPRHTMFFFYGGDQAALAVAARSAGYDARQMMENAGVIIETTTAVDEASFAPHRVRMTRWATAFAADYDGWECAVEAS